MNPSVLFCVLNWGLGHASRSIPIINHLIEKSYTPIICSDGVALDLLKKEYPQLSHEELPAYGIKYKHENIASNIILGLPKILGAINEEQKQIAILAKKYQAQFIISDNRYGCYSNAVPSFIMTHQLNLQSKIKWQGSFASSVLNRYLKRFDKVLIPDHPAEGSIAGDLIINDQVKNKIFLGPLSRMKKLAIINPNKLCIILSGPEPQRNILEELLVDQAKNIAGEINFVRGTNTKRPEYFETANFEVHDLLTTEELNKLICSAKLIISRSGYSSLMDYYFTGSKAILIPTPGQTEQEYLAADLKKKGIFYSADQDEFNLKDAIEQSKKYVGFSKLADLQTSQSSLDRLLKEIRDSF